MLRGKTLSAFIGRLEERRAFLYHACQLRDFESYLEVGGIPSRQLLERRGLGFTAFDTDEQDHVNDVWSRVFLNLQDFGKLFDSDKDAVPNPYGPILIRVRPDVLGWATDVAVCLRSASAASFDREREGLTLTQTEHVFVSPGSPKIKPPWDLKEEFGKGQSPELSCTVAGQLLPFYGSNGCVVEEIKVDPCDTGRGLLKDAVEALCGEHCMDALLRVRMGERGYREHYRKVVEILHRLPRNPGKRDLESALARMAASDHDRTKRWAAKVRKVPKLRRQFRRFASYLVEGTLA